MARYPDDLDRWRRAAHISAEAREIGAAAAVPGAKRRDVAEEVEAFIRSQGAEPAFPANLSRNDEAAHFTPPPDDEATLVAGDVLKVDVGAHLDGAIADTAVTVEVGGTSRHENLLRAAREAVEGAIAEVRAGVAVDALSRAIERAAHAGVEADPQPLGPHDPALPAPRREVDPERRGAHGRPARGG
jgi:methionyl aminopeptidase